MFSGVFARQQRPSLVCAVGAVVATAALSSYARGQEETGQAAPSQDRERTQPWRSPFSEWDKDGDGYLTRQEFPSRFGDSLFDRVDADGDGRISRNEDDAFRAENRAGRGGRTRQNANRERGGHRNAARRLSLPADVKVLNDVTYATVGDRKLPLDLYLPAKADKPALLVIWIHGGGWRSGSKENPGRALPLLERGYAVASVEYRLSGEAIFPAAIEDCKAAVSFLRLNAVKYNLDPDRFGVWGSSAGGHLVALLGTTNDVTDFDTQEVCKKAPATVQAVCDWFGPTDFLRMNDFPGRIDHDGPESPESRFIGGPIQQNKEKAAKANPITYVSKADPPILIMHGEVDQAVPYNQSELLYAALQKAGVEVTLYKVEKGDHGFRGAVDSPDKLFKMVADFFDKRLRTGEKQGKR